MPSSSSSPYNQAQFILANHCCLTDDDRSLLDLAIDKDYLGNRLSVFDLHTLTVLYYEACGMAKAAEKYSFVLRK